jgi:hypothetical protein
MHIQKKLIPPFLVLFLISCLYMPMGLDVREFKRAYALHHIISDLGRIDGLYINFSILFMEWFAILVSFLAINLYLDQSD